MVGGPSIPDLVVAAGNAGALGFLAAGYKSVEQLAVDIRSVYDQTSKPFGVNLFIPVPVVSDQIECLPTYIRALQDRSS